MGYRIASNLAALDGSRPQSAYFHGSSNINQQRESQQPVPLSRQRADCGLLSTCDAFSYAIAL
jgi:hypothetical protein